MNLFGSILAGILSALMLSGHSPAAYSMPPLTEPPALTVACGETELEALLGTFSWEYKTSQGIITRIEADSFSPLQLKGETPFFTLPSSGPHTVELQFEAVPDTVQVSYWGEDAWGQYSVPAEELTSNVTQFDLKDGNYIYKISACWDQGETYQGSALYSFYTTQ